MSSFVEKIRGDRLIWGIIIFLSVISLLIVYSSTSQLAFKYQGGNTFYYFLKHLIILGLGFGIIYFVHRLKFTYFSRLSQILIYLSIPLLLLTLFMGTNLNSANRWLMLPVVNISFQTSDLAKLALIMYLARVLSKKQSDLQDFKKGFVPVILPVVLVCGLILPADFSTSFMIFGMSLVLMFVGRVSMKYIGALIGSGILVLSIYISVAMTGALGDTRVNTWISRMETQFNSDEDSDKNYQKNLSRAAIVNGGVLGTFFHGENKYSLPHPYSDFVFATIIEDMGLLVGFFILFLYMFLLYRCVKIALACDNLFGMLLVIGCAFMLVIQALSNMAVAVGIFPVTGQPLPLVSMGGTSIWFTSIALGMILSVSASVKPSKIVVHAE